ncbi:uncharacterized protein At4g15970-like [Selaginella moellendorffii]|uniref:uncharacterized protein At4g15970-like n=1 Tax=Selaginella moellendorffii TaxID=88036 RepID=UPI000D1C90D5|nr:uncharacterized protein At4g15970-like [Selaginella moellendorffii]|eukprot:XP_024531639.1 uncharacterized protein At4g15970-like [Selaginella moellendorffii]
MRCRSRPGLLVLFYIFGVYNLTSLWSHSGTTGSWPTSAAFRMLLLPWIAADSINSLTADEFRNLQTVLKEAAFNKTVIVTPLNKAWASKLLSYFLASFQDGDDTIRLLPTLLIFTLDPSAHKKCLEAHPHCILLESNGVDFSAEKPYMTRDYLKMTRKKISFLSILLQMGYNFIFSDADVLWLRNPFSNFSPEADMELACDFFNGNETDIHNLDNTGLMHVRSNNRTIELFKYWDRHAKFYYHIHDQEVFDRIKLHAEFQAIGAKIRFMPTEVFSGFCEPASGMERVCTIHANCCQGLRSKLADLQLVQEDWNHFMRTRNRANRPRRFRAPRTCLKGCFSAFTSKPCYRSCYTDV